MRDNTVNITLLDGQDAAGGPLFQYDYGITLQFEGVELPTYYEVHFSNSPAFGAATTSIGNEDGVLIPDTYLTSGGDVFAWVFLHEEADDGETVYRVRVPVIKRPAISGEQPTPEEQSVITQAIAALNDAMEHTSADAETATEMVETATQKASEAGASAQSASQSEQNAEASAQSASQSASSAQASATSASQSASASAQSAAESADSAEKAEQSAANAGYMFFYIDEHGDLIYQRTSNTQVDFYLHEGDLYVRASA